MLTRALPAKRAWTSPEPGAEEEAALADDAEDGVVDEREEQPEDEVERVTDRFGTDSVSGDSGAQEEGDIHARQAELAGAAQDRRQDNGAGESTKDRSPDHRSSSLRACV